MSLALSIEPAANLVAEMLNGAGVEARIMPTDGFPVVYGDSGGEGKATINYIVLGEGLIRTASRLR